MGRNELRGGENDKKRQDATCGIQMLKARNDPKEEEMRNKMSVLAGLLVVTSLVLSSCGQATTPATTPETVEKVVTQVVQVPVEVTRIVEGTPIVETVVAEKVVEVQVTPTPEPPATAPRHGGTLTMIIPTEIKGLNNQGNSGTEGEWPENQITEGLVERDMDRNIVPGLATEWEISDDGLVYTFHLRKGVKFHDGTDFNAEDVKWTFDECLIPDSYCGSKWAPYIKGVDILDDYTAQITLVAPWYDFISLLAFEEDLDILSQESVEKWGDDYGYQAAVGTGPFRFDHWTRDQETVLVRNDEWWGAGEEDLPYLDKLVYRPVIEDSVKLIQLATKSVDLVYNVPFGDVSALMTDPNTVVLSMPGGTIHYLAFVPTKPPFDNLKVRQAITMAIDKQAIVDTIFDGYAEVANGIFPPSLFVTKNDVVTWPYDPEQAKALLAEEGYGPDNPLHFKMITTNATLYSDEAVLVQAQLKEIGVEAEVVPMESAAMTTYLTGTAPDAEEMRESFLYRYGYSGFFINDYTYRSFHTLGAGNHGRFNYSNAEVDALIEKAYQEVDHDKLLTLNQAVNDAVVADCPWVFIAFQSNIIAHQAYVHGMKAWPTNTMPMQTVWVDK
jgi:ABC-type transport system substrate-binding protein